MFQLATLVVFVCGAGAGYQAWAVSSEAAKFPPPGRLVDIGGRRLHLVCLGSGSPTVVFEASGFGSALDALPVRTAVARHTRVCSYDRRGMGWSDPGPSGPITVGNLVDDLDRLLQRAELPPPYVVVTASVGGLTTELFARRHPERVAGLVFLDAANSVTLERVLPTIKNYTPSVACLAGPAATVGLVRAVDPLGLRAQHDEIGISRMYRPAPLDAICGLVRGADQSLTEFRAAPPLARDVPLTVLIAPSSRATLPFGVRLVDPNQLRSAQQEFAKRSTKGTAQIVERGSPSIVSSEPEVVIAAILSQIAPPAPKHRAG